MFSPSFNAVLDRLMAANQIMDDAAQRVTSPAEGRARAQLWLPPVDLYETESSFIVEADLPGVRQEQVEIQFDRNTLTLSGTREATLPSREKKAQLRVFSAERLSGAFSRSVRLPEHVDAERITASFTDGVLTVTIPKSSQAVPRKITIGARTNPASIDG